MLHQEREQVRKDLVRMSEAEQVETYKQLMQHSLSFFIEQVFYTVDPGSVYHPNWHIDAIVEGLRACERGEIKRLIINIPPRSLKSISCTVAFPAWLLGQDPSRRILASSYSSSLSIRHNVDTRLVLEQDWYRDCFPKTRIAQGESQKQKFVTTERGFRLATSTGGSSTGDGGDYLIVDDPTNPMQAASEIERDAANIWFDQTFSTRLNDKAKGVIIIIMQRLHEDDLSGHCLAKHSGWEHLCLPSEARKDYNIKIGKFERKYNKGEILFPALLPPSVLTNLKLELGAFGFSGQYQQDPTPAGGGILKAEHWRLWKLKDPPPCEFILQVYDTAFMAKEEADYSARTTWGVFHYTGSDGMSRYGCLLIEAMAKRLEFPELREEVKESAEIHDPHLILIEDKGSGISLGQELRRTTRLPVKMMQIKGDKVSRAHMASPYLEGGAIWYMDRKWAEDVIKQCAQFPKGAHDDIVDTCTMAWNYLRSRFKLELEIDKREKVYGGKDPKTKHRFYGG